MVGAAARVAEPAGEGADVFRLGGLWWLLVDEWRGQGVYRSEDLEHWERDRVVLEAPGGRPWDAGIGRHADVVVGPTAAGDEVAWVFCFTHRAEPDAAVAGARDDEGVLVAHRTDVQVAQAHVVDGHLVCDRDAPVDLDLRRVSRLG